MCYHQLFDESMTHGHQKIVAMQYMQAIQLFQAAARATVWMDGDAAALKKMEALHMLGVCYRCVEQYQAALHHLDEAEAIARSLAEPARSETIARIMRDRCMVYLDRCHEGDLERAQAAAEMSVEALDTGGDKPWDEYYASLGFMGRVHLTSGNIPAAYECLRKADRGLRPYNQHYRLNNLVWLVRAKSESGHWLTARLLALRGIYASLCGRQNGKRIGSRKRTLECLVLLLGGDDLYVWIRERRRG